MRAVLGLEHDRDTSSAKAHARAFDNNAIITERFGNIFFYQCIGGESRLTISVLNTSP